MVGPDVVGTLRAHHPGTAGTQSDTDHIVVYDAAHAFKVRGGCEGGGKGYLGSDEVAFTISTHQDQHIFSEAIGFNGDQSEKTRSMGEKEEQAPTLRAAAVSHVAYAIQERAVCENPDAGPDGIGVRADDAAYTLEARSTPQAVAYDHPGRFNNIHGGSGEHQDVMPTLEATNPKQIVAHTATHEVAGTLMSHAKSGGWSNSIDHAAAGYMALVPAQAVAYDILGSQASNVAKPTEVHTVLRSRTPGQFENSTVTVAMSHSTVRRLTPVECERLQGFPDNFTAIPWRKKDADDCPDGPRYKALGNSMAVPVMRWIGERINLVDDYLSVL